MVLNLEFKNWTIAEINKRDPPIVKFCWMVYSHDLVYHCMQGGIPMPQPGCHNYFQFFSCFFGFTDFLADLDMELRLFGYCWEP